jgi:hypothetical protein
MPIARSGRSRALSDITRTITRARSRSRAEAILHLLRELHHVLVAVRAGEALVQREPQAHVFDVLGGKIERLIEAQVRLDVRRDGLALQLGHSFFEQLDVQTSKPTCAMLPLCSALEQVAAAAQLEVEPTPP